MGSGGGGGGCCNTTAVNTVRYAPYIEERHKNFLTTMFNERSAILHNSPFNGYTDIVVEDAFFGAGYAIVSFPSLYDMFGKFMAGLDIDTLWNQMQSSTINSPVMAELVAAEGELLDEEIETDSLPRMQTGMRDVNSVMSSSYFVAKSLLESTRTKALAKFSAELKFRSIELAQRRWLAHLDWNKSVISTYAEMMKLYYSVKTDVDEVNYSMAARNALWPFTVLEYERAGLGALSGATTSTHAAAGSSTVGKVLSGALSGAAMGAMIGGSIKATETSMFATAGGTYAGIGAIGGAALGIAAALTY